MSDMNRQAQLRQGLTQYVGAMLTNLSLEPRDASQVTAASLVEEATKLAKKEDDEVDFYIAKPLLRAVIYLYEEDFKRFARAAHEQHLDSEKELVANAKAVMDKNLAFLRKMIEAHDKR